MPPSVFPYSVLLPERFSGCAALHLRYPLPGFSRATSILSPHPVRRAPESFTPSAGFRRFPKNFVCRFLNCGITISRPHLVVNTIFRQFVRLSATHIRIMWTKEPPTFFVDGPSKSLLECSRKSNPEMLYYKRETRTSRILQYIRQVRVPALMRLNRRIGNPTYGGVRGRS